MRAILKPDGSLNKFNEKRSFEQLKEDCGIETAELLRIPATKYHWMMIDEDGMSKNLPFNIEASNLAGMRILGTVAIVPYEDIE